MNDIADFVKKAYFDEKLTNIIKNINSYKTRDMQKSQINQMIYQKKLN